MSENTDTAVFATDYIAWTIIFGLFGGNKGWSTRVVNGKVMAYIPYESKEKVKSAIGSVYVLPGETFQESLPQQFKSHDAVSPVSKVDVTLQDYYDLDGKIEWV